MITRIEAHNYRCFPKLAVDLDRYHVLAGANGAGKTTLLDIPVLRRRHAPAGSESSRPSLSGRKRAAPPRASTLTDLLHKGQGDTIAFAFEARLPPSVPRSSANRLRPASVAKCRRTCDTNSG